MCLTQLYDVCSNYKKGRSEIYIFNVTLSFEGFHIRITFTSYILSIAKVELYHLSGSREFYQISSC